VIRRMDFMTWILLLDGAIGYTPLYPPSRGEILRRLAWKVPPLRGDRGV